MLTLRRVMTVDATMAPAAVTEAIQVVASSATIDVMTTSQGTSFTNEVMSSIPVTRDIWSTMALAAGFQMASQDVGGSNLGTQTGFSAYGNDQAARTLVEGVIMGDGRAGNSGYFDYGSFDEFELGASGAMGEVAGPGGILNFSVKSGGESFHGSGLLNYQNDNMRSDNVPEALRVSGGVDENGFKAPPGGMKVGNNTTSMYDVNGDVGGPIKRQKVWFYVGAREQNVHRTVPGVPNFESQTRLRNVSGKVNYAINGRNTLIGFYNWREKFDPSSQSATLSRRIRGTSARVGGHRQAGVDECPLEPAVPRCAWRLLLQHQQIPQPAHELRRGFSRTSSARAPGDHHRGDERSRRSGVGPHRRRPDPCEKAGRSSLQAWPIPRGFPQHQGRPPDEPAE